MLLCKGPESAAMPFRKQQNCGLGGLQESGAPTGDDELPSALLPGGMVVYSIERPGTPLTHDVHFSLPS